MASIRETSTGQHVVIWRTPDHTQKCAATCTRTSHQRAHTFGAPWEAEQFRQAMAGGEVADKKTGRAGAPKAAPQTTPDFRSAAIGMINKGGPAERWGRGTVANYRAILSTQLGDLHDMSVAEVAEDRDAVIRVVKASTRARHALSLIRAVCRDAQNHGQITGHRLDDIDAGDADARRDIIPATDDQIAAIAATLDAWRPGLGLTVKLAAGCGLRIGEVFALRFADFREGYLTVRVSAQIQHGERTGLKSKRPGSFRDVPVPSKLAAELAGYAAGQDGTAPMFPAQSGGWLHYATYRYHFSAGVKAAGLPESYTPHQARHAFATKLLTAGVPLVTVAGFMGHSSTAMTEQYAHLLPSSFDAARAVLDRSETDQRRAPLAVDAAA